MANADLPERRHSMNLISVQDIIMLYECEETNKNSNSMHGY